MASSINGTWNLLRRMMIYTRAAVNTTETHIATSKKTSTGTISVLAT